MESRRKQEFKKGVSAEDGRRRRGETSLQLRKEKKEENLSKRRNMFNSSNAEVNYAQDNGTTPVNDIAEGNTLAGLSTSDKTKAPNVKDIPSLMQGLTSDSMPNQLTAMRGFRRLLSSERNPPVQECINCGAVPLFVTFLQRNDFPDIQFEAAWALTNIASTDRTRLVVDCGAVPYLAQQLASPSPDVREQCAWCLGNVAGDGAELREVVLNSMALPPLLANLQQPASLSLLRNCTWALSNFCRGKPQPDLAKILPAIPVLAQILFSKCDQETMVDAAWALSYISDGENQRIQAVVDAGVIGMLVTMLTSESTQCVVPSLRTLGNIVSGDDSQTQAVIDANVLPALAHLLTHAKKNIRKESCWMVSNIAAGNIDQINLLVNTPDLLPKLLTQLSASAEWDVRKEAAWVISNIATGGNKNHVLRIVEHGAIVPLCDLLDVAEVRVLLMAMEAIECILKHAGDANYCKLVDEAGGVEKLENLQEHENEDVYARAVRIIETYFNGEEEGESENLAPSASSSGNTFAFGVSAPSQQESKMFNFNNVGVQPGVFSFGNF